MPSSLVRAGSRDLRADFARGVALFCIFIDHLPDHLLQSITLHNLGPSDATELFIFLAGYAAAHAYGRILERSGGLLAAAAVLRRAWSLYVTHVFMFVLFIGQIAWSATRFDNPVYLEEANLGDFLDTPGLAVLDALTLRLQPHFMNILPLYIVLLAGFALVVPLLRRPLVLLVGSIALYGFVRLTRFNLPTTGGSTWFFNPLAWQLLFALGILVVRMPASWRDQLQRSRLLFAVAVLGVILGLFVSAVWRIPSVRAALPPQIGNAIYYRIDKSGLHPIRLAHFLALVWIATSIVPANAAWLRTRAAALFALPGQHGLPVFCLGILLSMLGRIAMQEIDEGLGMQLLIAIVGWSLAVALAGFTAWLAAAESDRGTSPLRANATVATDG